MSGVVPPPFAHSGDSVPRIMGWVALALVPAFVVRFALLGPEVLVHAGLALLGATATESMMLALRRRAIRPALGDGSAAVSALLLAACVPSGAAGWTALVGAAFGLAVAKHAYGGLGQNVFNPAMVGYAMLLVSFPEEMTRWHPVPFDPFISLGSLGPETDALSGATVLDRMRELRIAGEGVVAAPRLPAPAVASAAAYALGGAWLLVRRIVHWRVPAATLGALGLAALAAHVAAPDIHPAPLVHLVNGGVVLGAFFVATDPVTAPASPRAQWVFAAGIGAVTFAIRAWGGYPDGFAFAVLCMNATAPALDRMLPAGGSARGRR